MFRTVTPGHTINRLLATYHKQRKGANPIYFFFYICNEMGLDFLYEKKNENASQQSEICWVSCWDIS